MKITICGSMAFVKEMVEAEKALSEAGHEVYMPEAVEEYLNGMEKAVGSEAAERKIKNDFIRKHYEEIEKAEAILVLNYEKKGIPNYIGGNSFLEIGFAYILHKKIYLLNPIPAIDFFDSEIEAMQPTILNGDLSAI